MTHTSTLVLTSAVLLTILVLITMVSGGFMAAVAQPTIVPATKGDQCVADTDVMRKDHMDLLDHQRDDTVIDGVRGAPFSLSGCVDCHAQRDSAGDAIRVDAEGQFCQSCHAYAAVKIDCFSCHAAIPDQAQQVGLILNDTMLYSAASNIMSQHKSADYHAKEQSFFKKY